MTEAIVLLSGTGGMGRTALTAAFGCALARMGRRVLLVDLCAGLRRLDILLGLESRVVFDLGDAAAGGCEPSRAVLHAPEFDTLDLLAAPAFSAFSFEGAAQVLNILRPRYDVLLLDAPAGVGEGLCHAAALADRVLLLTCPEDATLRDAERVSNLLRDLGRPPAAAVLNRVHLPWVREGLQHAPETAAQVLDLPILGVCPEDDVFRAVVARRRLHTLPSSSPAAQAVRRLALRATLAERPPARITPKGSAWKEEWL
jgi:septum site-determining protein MinD